IGRFLSIDPILHTPFASQGTNAYSYVYNNPLSFRDPSGLSPDNVRVIDFSDCPTVIVAGADEVPDQPCPPKSGPSGNGASSSTSSQGTTGAGNRTQPGSAETTAHQPGAAGTSDGELGGGHSDPSTAPGRPGGSPHGVSYGKKGGAEEVPLFAGIGLFNTALGRWLSSFKVKASTKAALDGASILAAVFTGVTSFVAKLAKKAVRAGTKALGGAFRRFRRPSASRGGGGPAVRSVYSDGTRVLQGQQPPRIRGPEPSAQGPHSVLRRDTANNRVYQAREFDAAGNPVRDVDFTNPTFPNGTPRPGHPGPPHQHRFEVNDPRVGPRSGHRRGGPEPIP
ncbi:MAG: hypothetical protein MJE77_20070, partial [Proteobacteria bacterium]|nr:hypothetical protein [Pseudomonadota bacterium]